MKKVLFVIPSFKTGGFCTSLLSFLSNCDKLKYDIDVLVLTHQGIKKELFKGYNVLPENMFLSSCEYNDQNKEPFLKKWKIIAIKALKKFLRYINPEIEWIVVANRYKGYDTVVAFSEGPVTQFVSHIPCRNKVAWVHCNINYVIKNESQVNRYTNYYYTYNSIVCVADYIRKVFVDKFPGMKNKTIYIYNLSDTESIIAKSTSFVPSEMCSDQFNIISIGKFSFVKQFSKIPSIARKIRDRGLSFRWYVLGGVINYEEYEKFCADVLKYKLKDYVYAIGETQNPYPYLLNSNLLVCTSESEACPMVFIESKTLHVPICTTNFGSAGEFVEDGVNGEISPLEDIDQSISSLIADQAKYQKVRKSMENYLYNNKDILERIYSIL